MKKKILIYEEANSLFIMKRSISPLYILIIISFALTSLSFYWLWTEVSNINEENFGVFFPANRLEVLFFLSMPLIVLAPFLLVITIIGSYTLTKLWVKDVIINIITETNKKTRDINKIDYLSEEEKMILKILIDNNPEMIQSDLVIKSNLTKYKVTRILNKFEKMKIVKREKYGITNIIQLLIDIDKPIIF